MSAFATLTKTETRLFLRDRASVVLSVAQPTVVLLLLGSVPALREPDDRFGGQRFIDYFAPSLLAVSVAMLGLLVLPTGLATYREKGVLRRFATTPMRPANLLAVQLLIAVASAVIATVLMIATGSLVFGIGLPNHPLGFLAAFVLGTSAVFALGLVVAAVARRARTATGASIVLFLLVMFFAGVYLPKFLLPDVVVRISEYVPPGVAAMDDAWLGAGPQPLQLAVLAVIALGAAATAARLFRWE